MEVFKLAAQPRAATGRSGCRRLRRQGWVPAILYGHHREPMALQVDALELERHIRHEAFYSHILNLDLEGGEACKVVLKDLQRHPHEPRVLHLDLQHVAEDEQITMRVPLHFTHVDKCVGVKLDGGVLTHVLTELEVVCLPKDLPEHIEVDVSGLDLNHSVHLGDLKMPPGVQIYALMHGGDTGRPVASVQPRRTQEVIEEEAPAAEEQPEPEDEGGDEKKDTK